MKQLILSDIRKKEWSVLILLLCCVLSFPLSFLYKMMAILIIFLSSFYLFRDEQNVWLPFLVYPCSVHPIVISKIIVIFLFDSMVITCLYILLPFALCMIATTYVVLHSICFLLYTYVVADGYCGARQINVLQTLSLIFFFFSIYYNDIWFPIYQTLFYFLPIIIVVSILFIVLICPYSLQKKKTYQIALDSVMSGIKLMYEVTYEDQIPFLKRKGNTNTHFFCFQNDQCNEITTILIYTTKQLRFEIMALCISIMLTLASVSLLISGVVIVLFIRKIYLFYKMLHKVGIKSNS